MGFIPRLARSFGLVLVVAGGAAHAEVMHMPFDCRFDGARVHLRPAPERTYTVIGGHEREIFTACSPTDPGTCRNWFVHRFDFDCDGDRVSWIDTATAASRITDWDAWIENGRFHMRMNQMWGVARVRPGPRRHWMRRFQDRRDEFGDGGDRYGPRVVAVRSGFAPAVGIPLTFSDSAAIGEVSEAPPQPAAQAPAVAAYTEEAVSPPAAPPPIPDLPERAPPRQEMLAARSVPPVVAPEPEPAAKIAATQDAAQVPAPAAPAEAKTPASGDATRAGGAAEKPAEKSPGFTIINGPHATAAADAQPEQPAAAPIETAAVAPPVEAPAQAAVAQAEPAEPEPAQEAVMEKAPDEARVADAAPAASEPADTRVESFAFVPQPRPAAPTMSSQTVIATVATALALSGLAVFGFLQWRRQPHAAAPVNRDIGGISFGEARATSSRLALGSSSKPGDAPAGEALSAPSSEDLSNVSVPTTYEEALEVLGASADASTSAIKKIVDGLRLSWHPDHARSEADRLKREARVRQINVAWDLVSQERSAA